MLNISYTGCLGLFPAILAQFALEMCVAARNRKKNSLKPPILGVQGHSRSTMLTLLRLKKLINSACYDKQHVCAYLQPFSR